MRRISLTLILVLVLGCLAMAVIAQPEGSGAPDPGMKAKVDQLLAMPAKERRAHLKAMSPQERRGLWFQVKQAEYFPSARERTKYEDLEGFSVDSGGWSSAKPGTTPTKAVPDKAATGTIAYDSGFPTIAFGGGELVGNRFNTHTGIPVCNPGTVSTIRALVVPGPANTSSSVGFVLLGPQTAPGGAANALFSTFGVASGIIDSVAFAGLGVTYTGSEFFVLFGDFANIYVPAFGTGTTLAQGHHGLVGYTGGMGPNIVSTFNFGSVLNSYIRATGAIVPVELMSFEAE